MAEHTQTLNSMLMLHARYGVAGAQLRTIPTQGHRMMTAAPSNVAMAESAVNHALHHEAAKGLLGSDIHLLCLQSIGQSKSHGHIPLQRARK